MESASNYGVRKGIWSREEDIQLRKCIETYGEGKWHLVPSRAGLNRCRKSCRLRWLNYLNPNINRGHFTNDEVDLIIRLHKLLGNRWSLIAGRLPGRTGNDIKNLWNSHIEKRLAAEEEALMRDKPSLVVGVGPQTHTPLQLPNNIIETHAAAGYWWTTDFIDFSLDLDLWKLLGDE